MDLLCPKTNSLEYVELLDIPALWHRVSSLWFDGKRTSSSIKLYVFDMTPAARLLGWLLRPLCGFSIEVLSFNMIDVRDTEGVSVYSNVANHDLRQFREFLLRDIRSQGFWQAVCAQDRMAAYLLKRVMSEYDYSGDQKYKQVWHVFMMLHVVEWHRRFLGHEDRRGALWIRKRSFMPELQKSAGMLHIDLGEDRAYKPRESFRIIGKLFKTSPQMICKMIASRLKCKWRRQSQTSHAAKSGLSLQASLLVDYYGHLNLDDAGCLSDLFFLDPKGIVGKDVLLNFKLAQDPLDQAKLAQLHKHEVRAIASGPQATLVDPNVVPVFTPPTLLKSLTGIHVPTPWDTCLHEYEGLVFKWSRFFQQYNIKLWASWEKYDATHIAMADALARVGGIATIYQRSFESSSSQEVTVGADVIFGFSTGGFAVEQGNDSDFSYHVAVGYIGDHRFPLLKERSRQLRANLMRSGARRIIAVFDENTVEDERWFVGHSEACKSYAFWLEKVLAEPGLGVIFKPKRPATLRERLKPVAGLLAAAEATGRCCLIMGGKIQSSYPPAFAAMAADIAIHDRLISGTAGLEAALAGVPSLLLDLEGCPQNSLYHLGPDVVFRDWPRAWDACLRYFKDPQAYPHFGDWSAMIDGLDPFHDGRAAERMSVYLKELLEGLRRKEIPSHVMEMAAERYARIWGADKVQRGTRFR